jgi:hypothetical protein
MENQIQNTENLFENAIVLDQLESRLELAATVSKIHVDITIES